MDAIFAYELWNEAVVLSDKAPFSLTSGRVTAANGQTYDMANPSDRKRIIDDGFVFLIDEVRAAIRAVDPTALVTMGFFHDTEPNPARRGDNRLVRTRAVIERSSADFVDIHPYADDELTFPQFMQNYGIDGPSAKPIVMGEFGGAKRNYVSASQAATALSSWQQQSCAYGIDGWLLWTWDTDEQPDLWNALSGGGVIEQALAPKTRADPCA
jgi:endo-1,4-beta-mannosidase